MTDDKLNTLYAGFYEIIIIKRMIVYLALSNTKTYLKFHVSMLKKAPAGITLSQTWAFSRKDKYEIDCIIGEQQIKERTHFLIKWKNYDITDSTWEPRENLDNARTIIRKFRRPI